VLLKQYSADLVKLVELSVKKLNIGLQSDIELSQLKSQQSLIAAQIELTKHNIQLSSNAINYLLNKNPEQVKIGGNFAQLDFSKFKPGDLPANVLQNRPDIKMAEYALQVSHAKVGIDYSNLFPNIQLDKFVAGVTGNPLVMMPNQFSQYTDAYSIWGVEPSIFGAIEADKSAYAAQVYSYVQTVRRALKDTDNAFSANNRYTKNYQEIESAYMSLNKKLTLQGNLYKNGIIAYPDLLQSKLGVDDLSILLNQAKLQQASALVSLYQQLAGGYKYKESESYNKLKIDG
jgi:outer membrane protein TolC